MPMIRRYRTINEALDYLYSFINYEVDSSFAYGAVHYNVERTLKLLDLLGNPERDLRFIHVAGTKGKGSVCALLDALLRAENRKTGVFISPHVDRINERITVNGLPISDRELIDLLNLFPSLIEAFTEEHPTTFEILTAMAVRYFRDQKVDYAILETGMGGRFDSTNFCNPCVSIITSISYDHMDKLGGRIEEIAGEKAGIIKPGRPVVLGYQVYEVKEVFSARARTLRAPLFRVDEHCSYEIVESSERGTRFHARIGARDLPFLFLSLAGRHQVENVLAAMLSLEILGLLPGLEQLREALASLSVPTRLELIEGKRRFLLDSAHNRDSARVVAETLQGTYRYDRLITIAGVVKGKDIEGILGELARVSDRIIITEPVTHKELDTDLVISKARNLQPDAVLIPDIRKALAHAVSLSGPDDLILITGSFYTTSPARRLLLHPDGGSGERTNQMNLR
jgi:dihydrofolate synthase/folylpolyglutamate synthase